MKNNTQKVNNKSTGFTLIELVVVVAIMGLMSTMAMDLYTDKSNQKRFELTKQRLAEIKFAIIGDPMMRVGSQAITEGAFFKDMERLPRNLQELTESLTVQSYPNGGLCITNFIADDTIVNESTCTTASGTWISKTDDQNNWQGPYLHNLQTFIDDKNTPNDDTDDTTHLVFYDAWGNTHPWDTPGTKDLTNFGWELDFTSGDLKVSSAGLNRESGGLNYEEDKFTIIPATKLNYIKNLKSLNTGHCINTSAPTMYTIDTTKTEKAPCNAETDRSWAAFVP